MNASLTKVTLASVPRRLNVYLRFGRPAQQQAVNIRCRFAWFAPEQIVGRIWWEANRYGTTRWQLAIVQAQRPGQRVQRLRGIAPGALILLVVEGAQEVKRVLRIISTIESLGVGASDVSPTYWRVLQNRLGGRAELPQYGMDRRAAAQRGMAVR